MASFARRAIAATLVTAVSLFFLRKLFGGSSLDEDLRPAFRDSRTSSDSKIPGVIDFSSRFTENSIYTAVEDAYFKRLEGVHLRCSPMHQIGGVWQVCTSKDFAIKRPCLVYSFGVHNKWQFEEQLAVSEDGCVVRAYDPSMSRTPDHTHLPGPVHFRRVGLGGKDQKRPGGWQMHTLQTVLLKSNSSRSTVDIVKLDIEYFEWEALESALATGVLRQVKQLVMHLHTDDINRRAASKAEYLRYHKILDGIERLGFRRFYRHENADEVERVAQNRGRLNSAILQRSASLGRSCCHYVSYINMNFAKTKAGLEIL